MKHKAVFMPVKEKPEANRPCVIYVLTDGGHVAMYKGKWDGSAWLTRKQKNTIPDACVVGWMYDD